MQEVVLISVLAISLVLLVVGFARNAPVWVIASSILFIGLAAAIGAEGIDTNKYEGITETSYYNDDGNSVHYDFNFANFTPDNDDSTAIFNVLLLGIGFVLLFAAVVMYMRGSGVAR